MSGGGVSAHDHYNHQALSNQQYHSHDHDHNDQSQQQQQQQVVYHPFAIVEQQREIAEVTPNFCEVGYVMDTYCIELGTLVDKPQLRSLKYPDQHTIHCLIDVPGCVASGYEILSPPSNSSNTTDYGRVAKLDDFGNTLFVNYAASVGNCTNCNPNGTVVEGLQVTIIGYVPSGSSAASDGTPPSLNVTQLLPASVGCSNFTFPTLTTTTAAPVSSPTAPVSSPTAPVSSPTAPVSSPTAPVSSPTAPVSSPTAPVSSPTAPVSSPTAPVSGPTAPVSGPTAAPVSKPTAPTSAAATAMFDRLLQVAVVVVAMPYASMWLLW